MLLPSCNKNGAYQKPGNTGTETNCQYISSGTNCANVKMYSIK